MTEGGGFFVSSRPTKDHQAGLTPPMEENSVEPNVASPVKLGRPSLKRKSTVGLSEENATMSLEGWKDTNGLHRLIFAVSEQAVTQSTSPMAPIPSPITDPGTSRDPVLASPVSMDPVSDLGIRISASPGPLPPPPHPPPVLKPSYDELYSIIFYLIELNKKGQSLHAPSPEPHDTPLHRESTLSPISDSTNTDPLRHSPDTLPVKLENVSRDTSEISTLVANILHEIYARKMSSKTRLRLLKSVQSVLPDLITLEEQSCAEEKARIEEECAREARLLGEKEAMIERMKQEIEELQRRKAIREQEYPPSSFELSLICSDWKILRGL